MQTFTITDLSFTYPTESVPALQNVSLSIEAGSFTVLCGRSGCGKSTLLRQLKPILQPHGTQTGAILFEGKSLSSLSQREQSARIGFVLQNLDAQLVTDKVWHELAFGLESLGLSTPVIRRRVAEIASFFGIQNWFYKLVSELSGGQKQLVNLASVMALEPSVLLLDEPTSQLDPIAATDFLSTLGRINRELGTTIILSEHRLEDALALSTNVVFLERGRILDSGTASEVGSRLKAAATCFPPCPFQCAFTQAFQTIFPARSQSRRAGSGWRHFPRRTRSARFRLPRRLKNAKDRRRSSWTRRFSGTISSRPTLSKR